MPRRCTPTWADFGRPLLSADVLPAVHGQGRPGNEPRILARQEGDPVRDLGRLAEPADRDRRDDPSQNVLRNRLDHLGVDVAGAMALTVIPLRAFSWASALVKPISPALAAE